MSGELHRLGKRAMIAGTYFDASFFKVLFLKPFLKFPPLSAQKAYYLQSNSGAQADRAHSYAMEL